MAKPTALTLELVTRSPERFVEVDGRRVPAEGVRVLRVCLESDDPQSGAFPVVECSEYPMDSLEARAFCGIASLTESGIGSARRYDLVPRHYGHDGRGE